MPPKITQAQADQVKKALSNADSGRPSLVELAHAHEICARAGAKKTLDLLRVHIKNLIVKPELNFPRAVIAGILSGTIVTLTVGRLNR